MGVSNTLSDPELLDLHVVSSILAIVHAAILKYLLFSSAMNRS